MRLMTFQYSGQNHAGDVISTGCPKGARIRPGDRVRARIDGVGTLEASVVQGGRDPVGFGGFRC